MKRTKARRSSHRWSVPIQAERPTLALRRLMTTDRKHFQRLHKRELISQPAPHRRAESHAHRRVR